MPSSVRQSQSGNISSAQDDEIYTVLRDIQADLEQLRNLLATHVHSGVTAGGANTAVPTVTITAAQLNTRP